MFDSRNRKRQRWAVVTVEFAVGASVFMLFVFGILEYCRLIMLRQLMANAAREGARYAVVHTYDKTTTDVQNEVKSRFGGQDKQLKTMSISVFKANPSTGANLGAWTDAAFGDCIAVQIDASFQSVLPTFLMLPNPVNLQVRSLMYSEAN